MSHYDCKRCWRQPDACDCSPKKGPDMTDRITQALTGFTTQEIIEACDAAGIDDREFRRLMSALKVKAADTQATTEFDVEMDQALFERDEREEVINTILDEVLGQDRHEWSSSYRFADAIEDVKTRMWALTRPSAPEEAKDAAHGWRIGAKTPEVLNILGTMCFECIGLAKVLRLGGEEIPTRAESEQAHALHYLLSFYASHGDGWRTAAIEDIKRRESEHRAALSQGGGA